MISADTFRRNRKLMGLTQAQVAEKAAVHTNTVLKWEKHGITDKEMVRAEFLVQIKELNAN